MTDDSIAVKEQVQGTGTRSRDDDMIPSSVFATVTYKAANGRDVEIPVQVAGENITLQVDRPLPQK